MHVRFLFFNMPKIKVCHERINATIQSIVDPQNAVKQDFASRPRRFFFLFPLMDIVEMWSIYNRKTASI